jgi:thymidylate synthase
MNQLDKQYTDLLQDILDNGVTKSDRTGTGTISIFGRQIRHKMSEGFPLLTTKKMPFRTIITELLWFLKGDTNIKFLVDNNCHIWDGDAYKNYCKSHTSPPSNPGGPLLSDNLISVRPIQYTQEEFINKIKTDDEFAKKWGELGPIYGSQWRNWKQWHVKDYVGGNTQIDQIANLINDLKTNPDSRRLMVNAWNVGELDQMVLPPCHYGFQVYTRELSWEEREDYGYKVNIDGILTEEWADKLRLPTRAISLMWNQRSVDTFLGLPFNIASYGLLLEIIAKEVNMVPDELIGNLGDVHLYSNHIDQAKEQIGRELDIIERIDLASKTYGKHFDILDFGIPFTCTHKNIDEYYPVPRRSREPYPLPKLLFKTHLASFDSIIDVLRIKDFVLDNYQSHPTIKADLSN